VNVCGKQSVNAVRLSLKIRGICLLQIARLL